tara:strand:+ start:3024 stop:4163 length:1140 start_codon:yes stop_codon:yes gene_type:complete
MIGATPNWVPTQEYTVTSLAPEGTGTLRTILHNMPNSNPGAIIRFAVGGVIDWSLKPDGTSMQGDTKITDPGIIIAGETAPSPVSITGGTLAIERGNVEIRHLRFLPGDRAAGPSKNDRDCIRIGSQGATPIEHVVLRNLTLGWAVDGCLDLWHKPNYPVRSVTIEECIIAECLKDAGHPEGPHSTAVLVGANSKDILFLRCLLASCSYRFPAICYGATGAFVNCVSLNGNKTYEFNANAEPQSPSHWAFVGCETVIGNDKQNTAFSAREASAAPGSTIYYEDCGDFIPPALLAAKPWLAGIGTAYPQHALVVPDINVALPPGLAIEPRSGIRASLARTVGPWQRTALETRLVAEMLDPPLASIKANIAACPERAVYGF